MEDSSEEATVEQNGRAMLTAGGNAPQGERTASAKALRALRAFQERAKEGAQRRGHVGARHGSASR